MRKPTWVVLMALSACNPAQAPANDAPSVDASALPPSDVDPPTPTVNTSPTPTVIPDPTGHSIPVTPMAERDLPEDVPSSWLKAACDLGPCNGPTSRAVVLRDASGAAKRLYLLGDAFACSHSPAFYVDPDGSHVGSIAGRPMEAGETFESLHGPYRQGLVTAEEISDPCRGHE